MEIGFCPIRENFIVPQQGKVLSPLPLLIKQNCIYVKEHLNRFATNVSSFEYNLRNRKMLAPSKNSIENFKINIYNHLPNEIKDAPPKEFTSKLKEFLLKMLSTQLMNIKGNFKMFNNGLFG